MSRFAVYGLALAIVLVSVLLRGSGAPIGRSADDANAIQGTPVETGRVQEREGAGARSSGSRTKLFGADTGDEESVPGEKPESMRDRAAASGTAFRPQTGWPGLAEAEQRFRSEAEDPQWARQAEIALLSMISGLDDLSLSRLETDCRESICRLLLIYPPGMQPIYTIRQIYDRIAELGLGPMLADTQVEEGELKTLWLFLRRRSDPDSPR